MQTSTQGMKCEKVTWTSSSPLKYFPMFIFWNLHSKSNAAHSKSIKYYAVFSEVIFTEMNYMAKQEHKNPSKKPLWNKGI